MFSEYATIECSIVNMATNGNVDVSRRYIYEIKLEHSDKRYYLLANGALALGVGINDKKTVPYYILHNVLKRFNDCRMLLTDLRDVKVQYSYPHTHILTHGARIHGSVAYKSISGVPSLFCFNDIYYSVSGNITGMYDLGNYKAFEVNKRHIIGLSNESFGLWNVYVIRDGHLGEIRDDLEVNTNIKTQERQEIKRKIDSWVPPKPYHPDTELLKHLLKRLYP